MENEQTTIRIDKEVRDRLAKHGTVNDTFNDVIKRLLDKVEGKKK